MNRERQRKNEQAYRDRNAGRPRLPGTYLTEQESELLKKLATICGTQKKLFLQG